MSISGVFRGSALRHHRVEACEAVRENRPAVLSSARLDDRTAPIDEDRGRSKRPRPDALPLDLRIVAEGPCRRLRQAEIDRVAEVLGCKAQTQADRILADRALNRLLTPLHGARYRLGTRPQRGQQSALSSE
jgi:hypothetical protein